MLLKVHILVYHVKHQFSLLIIGFRQKNNWFPTNFFHYSTVEVMLSEECHTINVGTSFSRDSNIVSPYYRSLVPSVRLNLRW